MQESEFWKQNQKTDFQTVCKSKRDSFIKKK